jgi:DNA-binding transcriptional ArsR family regulator
LIEFLKVLADQTRLDILDMIQKKRSTSLEIQTALEKSQSTISQHLKMLSSLNLISYDKIDNIKYYRASNVEIFKLLIEIKKFVVNINKEKFMDLRDEDILDTLF